MSVWGEIGNGKKGLKKVAAQRCDMSQLSCNSDAPSSHLYSKAAEVHAISFFLKFTPKCTPHPLV